jgi:hypothetical protein
VDIPYARGYPSPSLFEGSTILKARILVIALMVAVVSAVAWFRWRLPPVVDTPDASAELTAVADDPSGARPGTSVGKERPFPRATKDQAKRDEIRRQLLAAFAEATAKAETEGERAPSPPAGSARGQRQTDDLAEFGRFIAQAIREDFIPMARACAKDLASRRPDAGGTALVAFELLGDKKIGGVVNSAEIVDAESSVHDGPFETCVRESLYGVYFDPPPAGGRATLRFEVKLDQTDGGIDDQVEDFHLKDKR